MESSKAIITLFCSAVLLLNFSSARPLNVTALYAFGDSTLDPGNNNYLATAFKSDHSPYGESFPNHTPTGRFTDGRLATDFIASWLGLKPLLPAYLDPKLTDSDLMTGVSFSSAGSGLDEVTANTVNVLTFEQQLQNFADGIKRIERREGASEARRIISNAVFIISAGTNDVVFNFYTIPISARRLQFDNSISKYHDFLLKNLQSVIQNLYSKGARRFLVAGLPPVGCLPLQITARNIIPNPGMLERACVRDQNHDSRSYNSKLQAIVSSLSSRFQGVHVNYGDIYKPLLDMVRNPSKYGFVASVEGCCGFGMVEAGPLCNLLTPKCPDPSKYVFWDSIHPTEAAYSVLAQSLEKTAFN